MSQTNGITETDDGAAQRLEGRLPSEDRSEHSALSPQTSRSVSDAGEDCLECGGTVVRDTSEWVCSDCGMVVRMPGDGGIAMDGSTELLEQRHGSNYSPGWSSDHLRTQMRVNVNTNRAVENGDQYRRMATYNAWSQDSTETNFRQADVELDWLAAHLEVPDHVVETARDVYRDFVVGGHMVGRSIPRYVYASLLWSLRQFDIPISAGDIAAATEVDRSDVTNDLLQLCQELDLDYHLPVGAEQFLPRMASDLGMPPETVTVAEELLAAVEDNAFAGAVPEAVGAAAVYTASIVLPEAPYRTQEVAAEACQCSEKTVRAHHETLLDGNGLEVDNPQNGCVSQESGSDSE
jgi:transcription initiation factor TFIIIB Brf1 subunit/transcription initiation factor TFIIB